MDVEEDVVMGQEIDFCTLGMFIIGMDIDLFHAQYTFLLMFGLTLLFSFPVRRCSGAVLICLPISGFKHKWFFSGVVSQ